jgi:hypothetical protein
MVANFIEQLYKLNSDDINQALIRSAKHFEKDNGPLVSASNLIIDPIEIQSILKMINLMGAVDWRYHSKYNFNVDYPEQFYEAERDLKTAHPVLVYGDSDANIWIENVADGQQNIFFCYLERFLGISRSDIKGLLKQVGQQKAQHTVSIFWESPSGCIMLDSFHIDEDVNTWDLVYANQHSELEAMRVENGLPLIVGNAYASYVALENTSSHQHGIFQLIYEDDGWTGDWSYHDGHNDSG